MIQFISTARASAQFYDIPSCSVLIERMSFKEYNPVSEEQFYQRHPKGLICRYVERKPCPSSGSWRELYLSAIKEPRLSELYARPAYRMAGVQQLRKPDVVYLEIVLQPAPRNKNPAFPVKKVVMFGILRKLMKCKRI